MAQEVKEAGVAEVAIDVLLDDVEGAVVGPAKGPDGEGEEGEMTPGEVFEEEKGGGKKPQDDKKKSLREDGRTAFQIPGP